MIWEVYGTTVCGPSLVHRGFICLFNNWGKETDKGVVKRSKTRQDDARPFQHAGESMCPSFNLVVWRANGPFIRLQGRHGARATPMGLVASFGLLAPQKQKQRRSQKNTFWRFENTANPPPPTKTPRAVCFDKVFGKLRHATQTVNVGPRSEARPDHTIRSCPIL